MIKELKINKILFSYIAGMATAAIILTLFYKLLGHKIIAALYQSNLWINLLMRHRNEWPLSLYLKRYDAYFISILWAMGYFLVWGILFILLLKSIVRRQKRGLISILALVIIIFSIIGFELGVRCYFRHRGFVIYLTHHPRKYLPYLFVGNQSQRLNLYDSYNNIFDIGLEASQNYPIKKGEDTFRIFFLGGSVAADSQKEDVEKRYYAILEKKLNNPANGKFTFECISAAVGGYISNQELIWLEFSGLLDMEPDIVVIFDGYNDIVSHRTEIGYPLGYNYQQMQIESIPYYLLARCSKYSSFLKYISHHYLCHQQNSSPCEDDREFCNLVTINYVKNIEKMCVLINGFCPETKIILALQPPLVFKKYPSSWEKLILSLDDERQSRLKEIYLIIFDYLKRSAVLSHRNIAIIDMMDTFDHTDKKIYHDPCHFGEEGSSIVAERFYNIIKDNYL